MAVPFPWTSQAATIRKHLWLAYINKPNLKIKARKKKSLWATLPTALAKRWSLQLPWTSTTALPPSTARERLLRPKSDGVTLPKPSQGSSFQEKSWSPFKGWKSPVRPAALLVCPALPGDQATWAQTSNQPLPTVLYLQRPGMRLDSLQCSPAPESWQSTMSADTVPRPRRQKSPPVENHWFRQQGTDLGRSW